MVKIEIQSNLKLAQSKLKLFFSEEKKINIRVEKVYSNITIVFNKYYISSKLVYSIFKHLLKLRVQHFGLKFKTLD